MTILQPQTKDRKQNKPANIIIHLYSNFFGVYSTRTLPKLGALFRSPVRSSAIDTVLGGSWDIVPTYISTLPIDGVACLKPIRGTRSRLISQLQVVTKSHEAPSTLFPSF